MRFLLCLLFYQILKSNVNNTLLTKHFLMFKEKNWKVTKIDVCVSMYYVKKICIAIEIYTIYRRCVLT